MVFTFVSIYAVPWAPGGSKYARNPPVPPEVTNYLTSLPLFGFTVSPLLILKAFSHNLIFFHRTITLR